MKSSGYVDKDFFNRLARVVGQSATSDADDRVSAKLAGRALARSESRPALGSAACHLRPLVGRTREAGLSVVMATQSPSARAARTTPR